jgi:hypothetical protein
MEFEHLIRRVREHLLGRCFSHPSELRWIADGVGLPSTPVEMRTHVNTEAAAVLQATPREVHVQAVRPVVWRPFFIIDVSPGSPACGI